MFFLISCSAEINTFQSDVKNIDKDLICVRNEDCVLTEYEENMCCATPCKNFVVNKGTSERRTIWREKNCDEEEFNSLKRDVLNDATLINVSSKWRFCLFEIQCSDIKYYETAYCSNKTCEGEENLTENKSNNDLFKKIFNSKFIDDLNESSACPEGYLRFWGTPSYCFPKTCLLIEGYKMLGDRGFPRNGDCARASFEKKIVRCNVYENKERDYCILAYYSTVLDTLDCNLLNDTELKSICSDVMKNGTK